MRAKIIYIAFSLGAFSVFGQDQDTDIMSRHRPGMFWYYAGVKPPIPEKVRRYDRLVFDLTYNDWISKSQKPFRVSPLSIGFNCNMMFDVPLAQSHTTTFGIGVAYGLYRVRMNDFFVRNEEGRYTELIPDVEQYGVEKSVFKVNSLSVPVEIRFKRPEWAHFKIHFGGRFSFFFLPSTVLSGSNGGEISSHQKTVGFYDFNHFNVSAHLRIGIRNWGFYASCNFLPLFKDEQSTKLYPIQAGVSISLF